MTLYHVTVAPFEAGQLIEPGRHGSAYRAFHPHGLMPDAGANMAALLWEIALEAARCARFPHKPSRLDCVFASETLAEAVAFRDKARAGGSVLAVEPVFPDTPRHRGDLDLLKAPPQGTAFIDHLARSAVRYWQEEPRGPVEVIVVGPVMVVEKLTI